MGQSFFFDEDLHQDVVFRSQWIPLATLREMSEGRWFGSTAAGAWAILDAAEVKQYRSIAVEARTYARLQSLGLILTQENAHGVTEQNTRWTQPHYRHPVHHIIVSTLRCNLSCSYCHAAVVPAKASRDFDLTIDVAEQILTFALKSKALVQSFEFQGGESLLNKPVLQHIIPRIRAVYAQRDLEVYLSVQTNGTLLTEKTMEFFRTHDVRVGTSYDGEAAVHDLHRVTNKGKPTSARVIDIIDKFGLPHLPTLSRQSLDHWRSILDSQLSSGARTVTFQPVYPINSARENWDTVGIDDDTFLSAYRECMTYLRAQWHEDYYPMERRMVLALRKLAQGRDVDFADFGNPCGMVHSQILYDFNGDIYTCDEGRDFPEFKIGNVATSAYDEVVFGRTTRELKSLSLPNDPECHSCAYRPFCSSCPVYERAVHGGLIARHYGTRSCKHTMLIFDLLTEWIAANPIQLEGAIEFHGIKQGNHWSQAMATEHIGA